MSNFLIGFFFGVLVCYVGFTVRERQCRRLAETGSAGAQYALAKKIGRRSGFRKNDEESANWLWRAAAQGLPQAQYGLAERYRYGRGVVQSDAEAAHWYCLAAEQGHVEAQSCIADYYFYGWGVKKDRVKAVSWCRKAAEYGSRTAKQKFSCYCAADQDSSVDEPTEEMILHWLVQKGVKVKEDASLGKPMPETTCQEYFIRNRIFAVCGSEGLFPSRSLPHGSWGLFSYDGRDLSMVTAEIDVLGDLFRREGRPLDEADPAALAAFICLVWKCGINRLSVPSQPVPPQNWGHCVVESADVLLGTQSPSQSRPFSGYEVRQREFDRVAGLIVAPEIRGNADEGWELMFTTVYGWMHNVKELGVENLTVTPSFDVARKPRIVLSERIFERTPFIRY